MAGLFQLLIGLASFASALMKFFEKRKEAKAVKDAIQADINDKEAKAARAEADVLAEYRSNDDGHKRLRDGKF